MNTTTEIWKDIPGYYGLYQVSNQGRVKSLERTVSYTAMRCGQELTLTRNNPEKILSDKNGSHYRKVHLSKDGVKADHMTHRLVAITFLGDYSQDGLEVAHNDGDKFNNCLSNLRWTSPKENIADKVKHGTQMRGESHARSKLTETDVKAMRLLRNELNVPVQYIADLFGTCNSHTYNIVMGRKWSHI